MNCFEYRRLCLSVPDSREPDYLAHATECEECRRYTEGVRRMDAALLEAMKVPVPDDLIARLKLRTVIDREQSRRNYGARFAIAASLVIAVTASIFGYRNWSTAQDYQLLTEAVVTHIQHQHSAAGQTTLDAPRVLANMFIDYGANDAEAVGNVIFTKLCPVMGKRSIHAVMSTPTGPVTMIFVPGVSLPEVREAFHDGLNNHLVPMGGGALILTSESSDSFEEITEQVQQAVEWEI